jgi:FtsP/CotA-like multicopper oxidase with cupredoxin domain
MQFRVVTGGAPATNTPWIQKIIPLLAANMRTVPVMPGTPVRDLTLNEDFDQYGRLIQRLGTNVQNGFNSQGLPTWARDYMDMPTEMPKAGSTEVWRIINLTGDTHPIHFHLSNAELIGRQPFDAESFNGKPRFTGPSRKPDPNERGLKDTIRMNPNEVTTVAIQFALPQVPFAVPFSPRLQAMGMNAYEYVWHCHILDHEEHDMMRPLAVIP